MSNQIHKDQKYYPKLKHTNNFKETGNHKKREGWKKIWDRQRHCPGPSVQNLHCSGLALIHELYMLHAEALFP